MRNLFMVSVTLLLLTACGSDKNSIPFVGSSKVNPAPEGLIEKAVQYSSACSSTSECNASRMIRQETIGLRLEATKAGSQDKYTMKISLSYSAAHDVNTCSRVEYQISDPVLISRNNGIENLGEIRCLEYNQKTKYCKSLLLKIEKTPSSVADSNGRVQEGVVNVLLENRSQAGGATQVFLPMDTPVDNFLTFSSGLNLECFKPSMPVITYSVDTTSSFGGTPTPYYDFSNYYY